MMKEFWKDIEGYEGLYQISSTGKIKSLSRYVKCGHRGFEGKRLIKEKIMKPYLMPMGYLTVSLRKNNIDRQYFIHRLVARTFIPNPNDLPCVNHKNENKVDNCIDNLEWCTYSYNDNYGNRNSKISESRKGIKFSDEHLKNLSLSHKKIVTNEFREKMRNLHLGRKLSEEHKRKISIGVRKAKGLL